MIKGSTLLMRLHLVIRESILKRYPEIYSALSPSFWFNLFCKNEEIKLSGGCGRMVARCSRPSPFFFFLLLDPHPMQTTPSIPEGHYPRHWRGRLPAPARTTTTRAKAKPSSSCTARAAAPAATATSRATTPCLPRRGYRTLRPTCWATASPASPTCRSTTWICSSLASRGRGQPGPSTRHAAGQLAGRRGGAGLRAGLPRGRGA